ncbi:MAG: hypothetical protein IJD00_00950 [Clostridia bacterium]|nr:hypothetical protein [Clostridia bacterium]
MTEIKIDFSKAVGKIKPMHAVGQPPYAGGFLKLDFSHMKHLKNANIPYARLHDVGGAFGSNRFVDIPNLFRNFDADENDPEAYDFAFTDELIKAMHEYDLKPIFRLGVTIENQAHIKAYRIHPPKDFAKWARICEHVIRHYNEGWANGFEYGIEYWEIWNEPENGPDKNTNQMWTGTAEEFYELYDVTAKHLKTCFGDSIKVGGYGSCGFYGIYYNPEKYGVDVPKREPDERFEKDTYRVEFFIGFLEYIKKHSSPIDFFSWHSYSDVEKTLVMDNYLHRMLCEYGYGDLERQLNEWNNAHDRLHHGTSYACAATAAMLCAMQNSHTDMLCYYDARLIASAYGGFFAPLTFEPVCTYYSFAAFGQLYALKNQVECELEPSKVGIYAVAAADDDKKAVMIANHTEADEQIRLNIGGEFSVYILDQNHFITKADIKAEDFTLNANQVVLIKNY